MILLDELQAWCLQRGAASWRPPPAQVEQLVKRVAEAERDTGVQLAWAADLTTLGAVSVELLEERLGRELAALARLLAVAVPAVGERPKSPEVYWRLIARSPPSVKLVACCRWLVYQRADAGDRPTLAPRWQDTVQGMAQPWPKLLAELAEFSAGEAHSR